MTNVIKLNREALRERAAARKARVEPFEVPEWFGIVHLRVMSGTERDAYEAEIVGNRSGKDRRLNLANIRARLVARCMVDESGVPLYDWKKPADIDEVGDLDAAGLDRVFKRCQVINGLSDEDVKELAGNSNAEANGASGTS